MAAKHKNHVDDWFALKFLAVVLLGVGALIMATSRLFFKEHKE